MGSSIQQIYKNNPHTTVSHLNDFTSESTGDFDLESTLQFVFDGHAAQFDFSCYAFANTKTDAIRERDILQQEIHAFETLFSAVAEAHNEFKRNASYALASLNQVIMS